MIIDCISDLHGHYPKLQGGDLLIVAGDVSNNDQYDRFFDWLAAAQYKKKVYIAGNHDNHIAEGIRSTDKHCDATYLCDSGTEFEGLKIWGSPWTKTFPGMNPKCKAFTVDTEEELAEKWALIPDDVDILVTHSPARSVLDWNIYEDNCGSKSLLKKATSLPNLKLFVVGHIHEAYGMYQPKQFVEFEKANRHIFGPGQCKSMPYIVNASHVNEHYEPVNKPIRIEL